MAQIFSKLEKALMMVFPPKSQETCQVPAGSNKAKAYRSIRSSVSSDSFGAGVSDCMEGGAMELLWEQGRVLRAL